MKKCAFSLLLACFSTILIICNAQNAKNVNNFITATWNTNGPRWSTVQMLMYQNGLDILSIQEAGSIQAIRNELSLPRANSAAPVNFEGFRSISYIGAQEYLWTTPSGVLYIYYFENSGGSSKQNMAIISKHKADEIIVIPSQVRQSTLDAATAENEPRVFINRPALGIRLENSIFFNIHAEPNRMQNEVILMLKAVEKFMNYYHSNKTWLVMGDFNRTSAQLQQSFPISNGVRFMQIVNTAQSTRGNFELDYGVIGGPNVFQLHAQIIQLQSNPSDHAPVQFNY